MEECLDLEHSFNFLDKHKLQNFQLRQVFLLNRLLQSLHCDLLRQSVENVMNVG